MPASTSQTKHTRVEYRDVFKTVITTLLIFLREDLEVVSL